MERVGLFERSVLLPFYEWRQHKNHQNESRQVGARQKIRHGGQMLSRCAQENELVIAMRRQCWAVVRKGLDEVCVVIVTR